MSLQHFNLNRFKGRKHRLTMAAAVGASLLVGGGLGASAQQISSRGGDQGTSELMLKNVSLVDASLNVALSLVQKQTHIDLVVKPGNYNRIYVSISNPKPVAEALKLICDSAAADLWQENGIYFVGPKGSGPRVVTPLPVTIAANQEPAGLKPIRMEKFFMKYTSPHRILRMLGLEAYNPNEPTEAFEVFANRQFIEGLARQPYFSGNSSGSGVTVLPNNIPAPANTPVPQSPAVGPAAPINGSSASAQNSASNIAGDQSAHRDGGDTQNFGRGQGALGGAGFGGQPGGFGGQAGGGGQPPSGAGQAAGFLQGIAPADIFALDTDNSLVLRYDDPQQILNLQEVLRVLDVKPRQIQIKAEFVTVTQNDVSSFGLNFNFTKVNLLAGANIGYQAANTAFIQFATGNLQTQLSFILTEGRGKVVASPIATTLNGVAAIFNSNQQIPVITSNAILTNNGQSAVTTTISTVNVSVNLQVLPRINGDESISLTGNVTFGDVTGSITDPSGGSIPITITQTVIINRIVRNGDSMIIAGLTRKRDNVSTNKVPLLGDLPLIGTLFRSRNVTTDDSELVVFITPTIIPERPALNTAGGGAAGGLGAPAGAGGLPTVGGALMP